MDDRYTPQNPERPEDTAESPLAERIGALLRAVAFEAPEETDGAVDAALASLEEKLAAVEGAHATARLREATTRIRLEAARRIQRATQLQRLLQGVQQMLATSGPDQLLEVVVSKTRDLLGCDISHMNLLADDGSRGHAFMRATEGAFTREFRELRTPPGHGVTALVARTRSPYTTLDYLADPRIHHCVETTRAMSLEGVKSMHAVPLIRGTEVLGVLAADYRRVFRMSSDQADILTALAALAALALDSARSLAEKQEAISELRSAHSSAQSTNDLLKWSGEAHDRLTNVVLSGGGLAALAGAVRDVFDCEAVILAADGTVLASLNGPDVPSLTPQEQELARAGTSTGAVRLARGSTHVWASPIVAGQEYLGALVVAPAHLSEIEQRTLERAALVTALLMMMQRSVDEAESRAASEVVEDLVVPGGRAEAALRKARSLGVDVSGPCCVLVAESDSASGELHRSAVQFSQGRGGLVGRGSGRVSVILPGTEPEAPAEALYRHCSAGMNGVVWVGAAASASAEALPEAHREASGCLRAVRRLRPDDSVGDWVTPVRLGFVGMLLGMPSVQRVADLVEARLGPLIDYDRKHNTVLVDTVETFFAERSTPAAALRLRVHRNTVVQRLNRVGQLLGEDWQDPDRVLELRLALRLHRLSGPDSLSAGM